jgi:hypothetical protein
MRNTKLIYKAKGISITFEKKSLTTQKELFEMFENLSLSIGFSQVVYDTTLEDIAVKKGIINK